MLSLSNLSSCSSINATSSSITDLIADSSNYSEVSISVKKNCCGVSYEETKTFYSQPDFTTTLPVASIVLSNFIIKQTTTGDNFTISLPTDVVTTCDSLTDILAAITAYMTTNFGVEEVFVTDCDVILGVLQLSFTSPTGNFYPISIQFTNSSLPLTTAVFVGSGFFINESSLIILPSIVSETTFSDAVYSITITFTLENGTIISQSGCIFMDCVTKCKVARAISISTGKNVVNLIMYHYGLTFANNCMCDCTYLCRLFTDLTELLNSILSPNQTYPNNCGCA